MQTLRRQKLDLLRQPRKAASVFGLAQHSRANQIKTESCAPQEKIRQIAALAHFGALVRQPAEMMERVMRKLLLAILIALFAMTSAAGANGDHIHKCHQHGTYTTHCH